MTARDWQERIAARWERAPLRLGGSTGVPALAADDAFRTMVAACASFRSGTRFFVLPAARFFVGSAQLRAPGTLLPAARDRSASRYARRVASRLRGEPFQLFVEQPLFIDFPLWSRARAFLSVLFERVGWPALPVIADMSLGNFPMPARTLGKRLDHAPITLVLRGRTKVRLWKGKRCAEKARARDAVTLQGAAGDLLYWPADHWHAESADDDCLTLRFWIPIDARRAIAAAQDALVAMLVPGASDGAVPYVPFPAPTLPDGSCDAMEPLRRTARAVEEATRGPALRRALAIRWTARVSAAALEPAPAPRARRPLRASDVIRREAHTRIVRLRGAPGEWIWAVNGHAFAVPEHPVAGEVIAALASDVPRSIDAIFGASRDRAEIAGALALLEKIHDLRGIDVVSSSRRARGVAAPIARRARKSGEG